MRHNNNRLNLLFITQDDPFYVKIFFEEFVRNYGDLMEIKGAVVCNPMRKKSARELARQMFSFYGAMDFVRMAVRFARLRALTLMPRFLRGRRSYSLEQLFSDAGIRVQRRSDVNADRFIDEWKKGDIDVIVSVAAPIIFKKRLLELAKWGCINIHHAKLPHYRGMMPTFWQMYHGEKSVGITVHRMNPKIDEGEIILQRELPIEERESLDAVIRRTKRVGAHCVIQVLESIRNGTVTCKANLPEKGEYFSFPTSADVREFRRRGKRIL